MIRFNRFNIKLRNEFLFINIKIIIASLIFYVSSQASAREIIVKYRDDPVNVSSGFISYELKKSSFVKEIFFDKRNNYLLVRLKKEFYHYCEVPPRVVNEWVNATSLGKFYQSYIKGEFDCRELAIPKNN